MMETLISLANMVNKTFDEMDMLDHQIKKIGSDIENLKQKGPGQGNELLYTRHYILLLVYFLPHFTAWFIIKSG